MGAFRLIRREPVTDDELKTWAEAYSEGPMRSPLAAGILRLLKEKSEQNEYGPRPSVGPAATDEPIREILARNLWGPPAPEDESHLDAPTSLSAPSLLQLADDGCPHAGEPD